MASAKLQEQESNRRLMVSDRCEDWPILQIVHSPSRTQGHKCNRFGNILKAPIDSIKIAGSARVDSGARSAVHDPCHLRATVSKHQASRVV